MSDADPGSGTAVRDSTVAVVAAVVLCAGLAAYGNGLAAALAGAAAVTGITVVASAGSSVMARAGRVCLRCRYPLPAAEDLGVCPECGDPFTHDDNLLTWRARYPWLRL